MIFVYRTSAVSRETSIGDIDAETEILLNENGTPISHIIVNQGKPGDMYDDSCDGTWLLRKDIAENRQWNSSNSNDYENSTVNAYLNGDWLNRYDPDVAEAIKQVKIPYRAGSGTSSTVSSGANGLSVKAFLLSGTEVSADYEYSPNEGAELYYFKGLSISANEKRVAEFNGSPATWWIRTPDLYFDNCPHRINSDGSLLASNNAMDSNGLRPCIILPYDFKLTDDQIVGVS